MARILLVGRRSAFEQLLVPRLVGREHSQCSDPAQASVLIGRGGISYIVVDELMPEEGRAQIASVAGDIGMSVIDPYNQAQIEHVITKLEED